MQGGWEQSPLIASFFFSIEIEVGLLAKSENGGGLGLKKKEQTIT